MLLCHLGGDGSSVSLTNTPMLWLGSAVVPKGAEVTINDSTMWHRAAELYFISPRIYRPSSCYAFPLLSVTASLSNPGQDGARRMVEKDIRHPVSKGLVDWRQWVPGRVGGR